MHLFGRGAELGALAAALTEAAVGSGRAIGVVGEPGIGKTRLAEEALALAAARGFATLTGRTPVREVAVAYGPFLEAVGGYLRGLDPAARAATTSGLSGLGSLFGSLVPGRVEPLSDPALEQARWFEAVARLLERIQHAAPTVVFVDDVHEADPASLALLHYLCRRLQGQRVLVLLTYRSDPDALRAVRDLRSTLRRHDLLTELTLAPLTRPDLGELAATRLDGPVSDALLDVLDRHAAGVPLFVETILLAWRDTGQLVSAGGCWTLARGAGATLPPVARDVVLRALDRLGADDRSVLDLLAVAGEAVPHERLASLAGGEAAAAERIGRLRAAGLVDEVVAGGQVSYRPHHPVLGEVATAELGELQRRRLHARYVTALERDTPGDLQRLARHYRNAGFETDPARAREVLSAAGAQALAMHANGDAVAHLSAALELERATGRMHAVGGLLEQLGDALDRVGEPAAAIGVWEEALAAADRTAEGLRAGRLHRRLAAAHWERGRIEDAGAHLDRGLGVLASQGACRELAELRRTEVWLRTWMHDFDAADGAARALAELAAQLSSPRARVEALLAEARLRLAQVRPSAAVDAARRALDAADATDDPLLRWHAHNVFILCVVWDGDHQALRAHAQAALAHARTLAVPALEVRSGAMMAAADFFAGDWDAAFSWVAGVLQQAPVVGQPRAAVHSVAIVAILQSFRGDMTAVERVLSDVEATHGRLDHDLGVQVLLVPARILGALSRDEVDAAVALADQALSRIGEGFGGWLLMAACEAYLRAGRNESALALTPRVAATAAAATSAMAGEALRIEGRARAALGERARALACLERARAVFETLDTPFFAARTSLDWARLHGGSAAAAAAREALEVFERLDARRHADEARHVLRALGVPTPRPRRPASGPLSDREREVACLAADGLTATEIADRLVISPHTVRTHLKRIHARLGVSSRAELTRAVIDAGWRAGEPR